LSTFPTMELLSSGDRLLRRCKGSGESHISHVFSLMYRNGNSSLLVHGHVCSSRRLQFSQRSLLLRRAFAFFFSCLTSSFPDAPSCFTGLFQSSQQHSLEQAARRCQVRVRKGQAPRTLAILNSFVLALFDWQKAQEYGPSDVCPCCPAIPGATSVSGSLRKTFNNPVNIHEKHLTSFPGMDYTLHIS
jgi:hypothetical protein